MKALYLIVLLSACDISTINAQYWPPISTQTCLVNGITFTHQNQITQFADLYPSCTEIGGDVIIQETIPNSITSLAGLSQITRISGDLKIVTNTALPSLEGLNNLSSIGGALLIFENDALLSLNAFQNLETIHGYLSVGKNDVLTELTGLEHIYYSITNLRIFANPQLSVCNLSNVCQYLANGGTHLISGNSNGCNSRNEISSACLSSNPCSKNILAINLNPILSGLFQAIQIIDSYGTIPHGENVNFRAGECINLEPGFSVERNVTFTAEIVDCGN